MWDLVEVVPWVLAMVSLVVLGLDFIFGKYKIYRFVLGELAFLTALAFAIQMALDVSWLAPYVMGIWFYIGTVNFARAIW